MSRDVRRIFLAVMASAVAAAIVEIAACLIRKALEVKSTAN